MPGLYLNQFYSLINNNPKYFKSKFQILNEIQNKIKQSYQKKSNSLIIEKKDKKEKIKIKINNLNKPILDDDEDDDNENKNDIIHDYYVDKSSSNFLINSNNNNNIFKKLNEK